MAVAKSKSEHDRDKANDQLFSLGEGAVASVRSEHLETAQHMGKAGRPIESEDIFGWASGFVGALSARANELRAEFDSNEAELRDRTLGIPPKWLNIPTMLVATALVGFALWIDYAILNVFWTGVLSDQFGKVPKGLQQDVVLKSGQVLVAVLAMHLYQEYWGPRGRKFFAAILFWTVIAVVAGFGFLIAKGSLSVDATFGGMSLTSSGASASDELAGLGLGTASAPASDGAAVAMGEALQSTETLVFLAVMMLVFFLVTSFASYMMHYVTSGWRGLTNSYVGSVSSRGIDHLNYLRHRNKIIAPWLRRLEYNDLGWSHLNGHLAMVLEAYRRGRKGRIVNVNIGIVRAQEEHASKIAADMTRDGGDWDRAAVASYFQNMAPSDETSGAETEEDRRGGGRAPFEAIDGGRGREAA